MGRLRVARGAGVQAASRGKDVHLLARQAGRRRPSRCSGTCTGPRDYDRNMLLASRAGRSCTSQPKNDHIGAPELVDQGVGILDYRLLRGAALAVWRGRRRSAPHRECGTGSSARSRTITAVRVGLAPAGDEALGQAARLAPSEKMLDLICKSVFMVTSSVSGIFPSRPWCPKSAKACWISRCVFMTKGSVPANRLVDRWPFITKSSRRTPPRSPPRRPRDRHETPARFVALSLLTTIRPFSNVQRRR